jgi:hypothetical protein
LDVDGLGFVALRGVTGHLRIRCRQRPLVPKITAYLAATRLQTLLQLPFFEISFFLPASLFFLSFLPSSFLSPSFLPPPSYPPPSLPSFLSSFLSSVLGLKLRTFTLSHSANPFCDGYFRDRVSRTVYLGWLQTRILLISAS